MIFSQITYFKKTDLQFSCRETKEKYTFARKCSSFIQKMFRLTRKASSSRQTVLGARQRRLGHGLIGLMVCASAEPKRAYFRFSPGCPISRCQRPAQLVDFKCKSVTKPYAIFSSPFFFFWSGDDRKLMSMKNFKF